MGFISHWEEVLWISVNDDFCWLHKGVLGPQRFKNCSCRQASFLKRVEVGGHQRARGLREVTGEDPRASTGELSALVEIDIQHGSHHCM